MSFYFSSAYGNRERVRIVASELATRSRLEWIYDWTIHDKISPELAAAEINAVVKAKLLVVLLPGGFGTHVEIGAALAHDKPVFVIAERPEDLFDANGLPSLFLQHPLVMILEGPLGTIDLATIIIDECRL